MTDIIEGAAVPAAANDSAATRPTGLSAKRLPELQAIAASLGGIRAVGRLLAALPADFPLPILVLPLLSPVVIAAIRATATLTEGSSAGVAGWLGVLLAFDAAFLATGYLVFGHLLED